jgi:hypothetical protein
MLASLARVASSDVPDVHCLEDDLAWRERWHLPGAVQFDSAVFRGRRTVMTGHLIIEVRAAEGGDDAKALVVEQVAIYTRLASRRFL